MPKELLACRGDRSRLVNTEDLGQHIVPTSHSYDLATFENGDGMEVSLAHQQGDLGNRQVSVDRYYATAHHVSGRSRPEIGTAIEVL